MADSFNAVDIIYEMVKNSGVSVFKDKAPQDQPGEHIVVNCTTASPSSYGTNDAQVNLNIFVPVTGEMVPNRSRIKAIKDTVETLINVAGDPSGYYYIKEDGFEGYIQSPRKEFDCFTMRKILILNR